MIRKMFIVGCLFTFGCATMQSKPIVYFDRNYDPVQYAQDLTMCESWAKGAAYEGTASVTDGAVTGAVVGALISAGLGAILGAMIGFDPGLTASIGAASGAYSGGLSGAAFAASERERRRKEAVLLCLKRHGYEASY